LGLGVGVGFLNHFLKIVVTLFNWNAYINQQVNTAISSKASFYKYRVATYFD
jgi:hypothetical protein